jgi:2-methylcitrate dehydratase PrpD
MSESTITARIAEWVAETTYEQLPRRVVEEAKNQILSVIAAVHAGHFSEAGRITSRTVKEWAGGKEATLIPSGERTSIHYAIFGNAALSMALDYDDYLFAAHTGHSAVIVPLALGEKLGISGQDFLVAQVMANEVEGRVGAAGLMGPSKGQLAGSLHQLGAAIIAARLMKLDRKQIENAIGIAMLQPCLTVPAGFFGSEAKTLLASMAAPIGVQAAELAANGMRGAADAFESAGGFLQMFAPTPVEGALEAFGKVWLTETLGYKIYPGCAYIGSVIDCVLALLRQHHIDGKKVRGVDVSVGPAALNTDAQAKPYVNGAETATTTLNFSLAYNVAAALMDKELSPRQFTRDRVKDAALWDLAGRVRITQDERMAQTMRDRNPVRTIPDGAANRYSIDLATADLVATKRFYGSRVRIEMEDGRSFEMEQEAPQGSGARQMDDRRKMVEDKFRRETRYTLRKERMEKAIDLVHHLESAGTSQLRELVRLCCSERG